MQFSRNSDRARRSSRGGRRRATWPIWLAVVAAVLGVAVVVLGVRALDGGAGEPAPAPKLALSEPTTAVEPSQTVEVPDVVGATSEDAQLVLVTAGFEVRVITEGTTRTPSPGVVGQEPEAGALVTEGTIVTIRVPKRVAAAAKKTTPKAAPKWVVCVDPGHQENSDSSPEPIGPGSKTVKPAVTGGTTGKATKIPEYEIALQISMNLKKRLEDRGVKVVMTRMTNDVSLSNAQRAAIANKNHVDLFVRVHGDGSPDEEMAGVSTLYPASTKWTTRTTGPSKRAAALVQSSVIAATGAVDRGLKPRTDISGFNYATMPSILVETGFMSNPVEDRLLASPHYQDKIAVGMADGIVNYLREAGKWE